MFPKEPVSRDFEGLADFVLGIDPTAAGTGKVPTKGVSILSGLFGRKQPART